MSVFINGISYDVEPGTDQSPSEAVARARTFRATSAGDHVYKAEVDRNGGLVLLQGAGHGYTPALHLRTPSYGSRAPAVQAAAEILEMFGFGDHEQLLNGLVDGIRRFSK